MHIFSAEDFHRYNPKNLTHCALWGMKNYTHLGANVEGLAACWGSGAQPPEKIREVTAALFDRMDAYRLELDRIEHDYEQREGYLTDLPQRIQADEHFDFYATLGPVPKHLLPAFEISDDEIDLLILAICFELKRERLNEDAWADADTGVIQYLRATNQRLEALDQLIEPGTLETWETDSDPNDAMLQLFALGDLQDLREPNQKPSHDHT